MKRTITLLLLALGACCAAATAQPKEEKPFVIPELREWRGAEGSFTPTEQSRIVLSHDSLRTVGETLAADWQKLFGRRPEVTTGKAAAGDLALTARADKRLPDEGYRLTVDRKGVRIAAPNAQGLYWGTRTLLQLLEQSPALPAGEAVDYPDYGVRGLSLDVGRKFFPMDYLRDLVEALSYHKFNQLRIHLNDNGFPYYFDNDWDQTYSAFRLESTLFPGLTARDGHYTKREFKALQRFGRARGVEIIPEIDIPAHALAFAHYRPELGSKEFGADHLDLFNPATMPFLDSLFAEYLAGDDPVFEGRYVHIGTDEFGKDYPGFDKKQQTIERFRAFTDHYIRLVESYGKQPWVWGSLSNARGETPVKTQGLRLDCWYNGYAAPREMVALGCRINSIPDGMVYIVPMAGYYYDYLNTEWLYNEWTPANVGGEIFEERDPALLGGYFAVWNDHVGNGVTVSDVHHRVMPALQTLAVKLWDGRNVTVPYADFDVRRQRLSEAPGVNRLARAGRTPALVCEQAEVHAGDELPLQEIGFGYTVEFDLDAAAETAGTVLFESPDVRFYLSDPIGGQWGFAREGYLRTFGFAHIAGERLHVEITGDNRSTTLRIDGRTVRSLTPQTRWYNNGKNKMNHLSTLVFPLRRAGGFKSRVTNLKVYNYMKTE